MCTILETWIIREGTYEDSLKMRQIQNGENLESLLTDKNWISGLLEKERMKIL